MNISSIISEGLITQNITFLENKEYSTCIRFEEENYLQEPVIIFELHEKDSQVGSSNKRWSISSINPYCLVLEFRNSTTKKWEVRQLE